VPKNTNRAFLPPSLALAAHLTPDRASLVVVTPSFPRRRAHVPRRAFALAHARLDARAIDAIDAVARNMGERPAASLDACE